MENDLRSRPSNVQTADVQKLNYDNNGSPTLKNQQNNSMSAQTPGGMQETKAPENNWWELRFKDKMPERRSYHTSFVQENKLYIHGGEDIMSGHLDNMWCIDLSELTEFNAGSSEYTENPEWQLVQTFGAKQPHNISHHSSVVYQDKMYLFGGSAIVQDNSEMYALDLHKHHWSVIKHRHSHSADDIPQGRDDPSCVIYEKTMVLFGGFKNDGERCNETYLFHFGDHRWEKITSPSKVLPDPRAGHSAVVSGDEMYIFGGKDSEVRMDDLWKFNLKTYEWTKINSPDQPSTRCGHNAQLWGQYMIIYGGFFALCQELNDMHVFDLKNQRWVCLFEELNSSMKETALNLTGQNTLHKSPTKLPGTNDRRGTMIDHNGSLKNMTSSKKKTNTKRKSPKKLDLQNLNSEASKEVKHREIESPTFISMANSFLIREQDPSFEKCYQQIKKREHLKTNADSFDSNLTKNQGKRPPARDGHTGVVVGNNFFIFGGDRNRMPFNDFHMLDLKSEFNAKSYIF